MDLAQILSNREIFPPSRAIELRVQAARYNRPCQDHRVQYQRLPLFAGAFHAYIVNNGTIPLPDEFVDLYFALNASALARYSTNGLRPAVEARLLRAWPSLVRDVHLMSLLREAGLDARYSLGQDRAGADIVVRHGQGAPLALNAFWESPRAHRHRDHKRTDRHAPQGRWLDLPLRRTEALIIGNVFLYTPRHVARVRRALDDGR